MMRWDIINHLIKENNYKSYLEIGYYKGWSFDNVKAADKTAVDPNPSKNSEQEKMPLGTKEVYRIHGRETGTLHNEEIYKMTSDEFFRDRDGFGSYAMPFYDIIFIDGLHEAIQVSRDIQNSLKHLAKGGTIVMHDCNPSSYEMTTTGTVHGEWTGDVYKAFLDFKHAPENEKEYSCYVVDTDYGVGIIHEANKIWQMTRLSPIPEHITKKEYYSFPVFEAHKTNLLHLVTPDDFLFITNNRKTMYNGETTTDTNLPA